MGWANCGEDSKGRPIGYAHSATCDHPGCKEKIDRGLSYACGGMHGETDFGCEGYFCEQHLPHFVGEIGQRGEPICQSCANILLEDGEWRETTDEDEEADEQGFSLARVPE